MDTKVLETETLRPGGRPYLPPRVLAVSLIGNGEYCDEAPVSSSPGGADDDYVKEDLWGDDLADGGTSLWEVRSRNLWEEVW